MPKPIDEIVEEVEEVEEEIEEAEEDEEAEGDGEDESNPELEAAQKAYVAKMTALGAQFDDKGNFVGWGQSGIKTPAIDPNADPNDIDTKLAQRDAAILAATRPASVSAVVDTLVASNPSFKDYEGMVKSALLTDANAPLDPNSVTTLFYFFRGQATDLEVAKAKAGAKKTATRTATKVAAGSAAASDGGGGKGTPGGRTKHAPITDEIRMHAQGFGIDPQVLADKLAAAKKGRK